ncbi:hypothetical protein CRYUN_Cryun32bG0089600 [Craigia yunnanensis]
MKGSWGEQQHASEFSNSDRVDGGWDASRIDQAHPVGVASVSLAPSTELGAVVGSGFLDPVKKLCSGGCDNNVKFGIYYIPSASQDTKLIIWTVAKEGDQWEGKVLHDFYTLIWRVSWSLPGNVLAVADRNNDVTIWKETVVCR